MSSIIQLKRNNTKGKKPASLEVGELAINIPDRQIYVGDTAKKPVALLTPPAEGWNIIHKSGSFTVNRADGIGTLMYVIDNSGGALQATMSTTGFKVGQFVSFMCTSNPQLDPVQIGGVTVPGGLTARMRATHSLVSAVLISATEAVIYGDVANA